MVVLIMSLCKYIQLLLNLYAFFSQIYLFPRFVVFAGLFFVIVFIFLELFWTNSQRLYSLLGVATEIFARLAYW